jgi:uncharacterized membrane protein
VNLREWRNLARPAVVSFAVCAAFVMVLAFLCGVLVDLGPEGWKVAGMLVGTYTGGSMNLVAIGTALNASSSVLVAVNAADILWFAVYTSVALAIPPYLKRMGWKSSAAPAEAGAEVEESFWKPKPITLYSLTSAIALAALCFGAAYYLKQLFAKEYQSAWQVLILTTLALVLAQSSFVRSLPGNEEIGSYLMHMFFVAIGATSNLSEVVKAGPAVLLTVGCVVFGAFVFQLFVGRILKIDYETLLITGNASIGGPTTAATMAIALRWRPQVVTGLITGLIGYAVGNYLGIAVATLLKAVRPGLYTALLEVLRGLIV